MIDFGGVVPIYDRVDNYTELYSPAEQLIS